MKDHLPNMTGTPYAYEYKDQKNPKKIKNIYTVWRQMTIKYLKFFFGLIFFVFIFLVLFSERETTQKNFKNYNITFNKIDGVQIGTDVFISGINVGFVNKITLKKNYRWFQFWLMIKLNCPVTHQLQYKQMVCLEQSFY